jgi:hypothetical protein
MAKRLQLRGGTTAQNNAFTGAPRELTVDTSNWHLRIHDGATIGGNLVSNQVAVPVSSKGVSTDRVGFWAADSQYFYYCIASYINGVDDIWKRVAFAADTWQA